MNEGSGYWPVRACATIMFRRLCVFARANPVRRDAALRGLPHIETVAELMRDLSGSRVPSPNKGRGYSDTG